MYKGKLQELCQRRRWELPEYTTAKDGPGHMLRFTATVNVNGQVFATPVLCRSAKDAQNTAAQIAFDHFNGHPPPPHGHGMLTSYSAPAVANPDVLPAVPLPSIAPPPVVQPAVPNSPPPSSLPIPTPGLLAQNKDLSIKPANEEPLQQNSEDTTQNSTVYRMAIGSHDISNMYKNQLQQYGQKQNIGYPVYTSEAEGPPHARRFRARVSLDGKSYETLEFFTTLREAEQAAAKVACQLLSIDVIHEDGGLYKNLLQEFAQKNGLLCPSYDTASSGLSHRPVFVSTVEVGSNTFRGAEAKTKKQAEMNAAKVAYYTLTKSDRATDSSTVPSTSGYAVAGNVSQNSQPTTTIERHQNATEEEVHAHAKRAKCSPEIVNVNTDLPGPSQSNSPSYDTRTTCSSQGGNSISAEPVCEQPVGINQPLLHKATVVFPRKSNFLIPECASVMPCSDDQWVAYKVKPGQGSNA